MTELAPQIPAEGIWTMGPSKGSRTLRVSCNCGDSEHNMWIDIEAEPGVDSVDVSVYTKQTTDYWSESWKNRYDINNGILQELYWRANHLYNSIATRLRLTWEVWMEGQVTYQATTCMNRQQALNLSAALADAVRDVKEETK
jgi:hypothetical protein